jgi:hypothetical protein
LDTTSIIQRLHRQILTVAIDSIFESLREQDARGYSSTAYSTCEKITMAFTDADGNSHSLSVLEYHKALLQGASPFLDQPVFQYNLANHFVHHLEPAIREKFANKCKDHLTFADLSRDAQMRQLAKYLRIATECEKDIASTKRVINSTIGDTHSFVHKFMNAVGMPIPTDLKTTDLGFLSAAEKTLQRYKDDQRGHLRDLVKKVDECWGCKGPHLWRDRRTKEICCPNKDVPGVAERATKMHKQYLEDLKKKKGGWVQKNKIKFAQLTDEQKEIGRQYFLQQAQTLTAVPHSVAPASTNTSVVTADTGARSYPVVVIHNSRSCKPILPVSVDGQLPHITVVLGHLDDPLEDCASVRALFDSGASLSSGSESFWLPLLKGHPNVVEDVFTSDKGEFQPIILGGIVCNTDGDMSGHTTELTLVVQLRLRYETKNHQPVFHTIAIGKSVGVNTIFGKPFIKSLQCTYDCYNNTVEAGLLNAPPFKITDMYPQ